MEPVADAERPPARVLVGRREELSALERELARAAAGELRCVLLTGDAGVGKTRLARELLGRDRAGTIALQARGYPLGATAAYELWVEALEPVLEGMSGPDVTEVCGEFVDDLATILRPVAAVRGSAPGGALQPRLADGIGRVLANLASRATVIVVLDDIHLVDPSSLETLRRLSRQWLGSAILVLCTARLDDPTRRAAFGHVEFELEQDGILTRLELAPLDSDALGDLAASIIGTAAPAPLVDWLAVRSQGNPLYAIGLVNALLDERADLSSPQLQRLPEPLAERVQFRVAQFPESAQRVLEFVAVAGRPLSVSDLELLTGQGLDNLAVELDSLVAARALVADERGRDLVYALSHPLVRDAIYQDIGSARRRLLHRQTGRAFAVTGRVSEAARHLARAAHPGDDEALDILLVAIRQAEAHQAYREALELTGELVELLPEGDERWRDVFDAIRWNAEWVIDHRADAHGALGVRAMRAIARLFDTGGEGSARRAQVKLRLGSFLAWGSGDLAEAAVVCREARELFTEAGDHTSALLAAREEAFVRGLRGDLAGMEEQSRAILAAAEAEGSRFVAMQALSAIGYAGMSQGHFDAATSALNRAIEIAVADEKGYRVTTALATLALVRVTAGEAVAARECLDRAMRLDPAYRDSVLPELEIIVTAFCGDVALAVTRAHAASAWGPPSLRRTPGMSVAAIAAIEADQPADADRFLARAQPIPSASDWSVFSGLAAAARGMRAIHRGKHGEGLVQLRLGAGRLIESGAPAWAGLVLVEEVDAAADAEEAHIAVAAAAELELVAGELGRDAQRGLSAWATGRTLLLGGRSEEAAAAAREAVRLLEPTGWEGQLARALHLLGRADPDRTEAVSTLERAANLYERNGAAWRRTRVLDDLRRLGRAGERAAAVAAGAVPLSRREREVAALAAGGMSAREISATLFVGERTVESHLSRAYAKLGVASKLELVRRAAELGLTERR